MDRLGAEKTICHAERLIDIKEKGDTYPVHMAIGITDYCCHKCIFCNTEFATADAERVHSIDADVLIRFLTEAKEAGLKAVTLCGSGEPLIHPHIEDILYGIHETGLEIGIFTNASRMPESVKKAILDTCTFVRCSVNASNTQEHEIVHQVKDDFHNVVENIKELVKQKRALGQDLPTIGTQFVFYDKNYLSIERAAKLWKEVGVDYFAVKPLIEGEGSSVGVKVFSAQDKEAVKHQMELAEACADQSYEVHTKFTQYQKTLAENDKKYRLCYGQAMNTNLWADGNMFICQNQEHERDIIGNIYHESFMEIWHGEKRRKRIQQIRVDECPRGCRCDPLNDFIWDYLYPDKLIHPNFI